MVNGTVVAKLTSISCRRREQTIPAVTLSLEGQVPPAEPGLKLELVTKDTIGSASHPVSGIELGRDNPSGPGQSQRRPPGVRR